MQFKNLDDIIDFAIAREREAADFYRSVSEQESFRGKKEMFLEFAAEEGKHEQLLLDLKAGKTFGPELEGYSFKWITDIKRSDFVDEIEYKPGMAYNEILLMASKREEKALALYNECLANAESDDAKKVFKMLCQEEAKHKLALETMLDDFMAQMGD